MSFACWRYTLVLPLLAAAGWAQLQPAQVIILVGPPGAGKSVQAQLLAKRLKIPSISMASLLKDEMGKNTVLAKALASSIASGELVGDEAANGVMKSRLLRKDTGRGFILDGYPMTNEQASALDTFLLDNGFSKPTVVLIEAPDSVVRARMKSRKRVDDTPSNIDRRIREYRQLETVNKERYGSENTVRVDGSQSIQTVASAIAQQIGKAQKKELKTRSPLR